MGWKIYYDDETIVDNNLVKWEDTPPQGVLFVLEIYKNGKSMVHMGMNYYFMRDGTIISCNLQDLHTHLTLGMKLGYLKFGRWTPNDVWERVHKRVFS